ncbi:31937_t:CDS:2 [Gigaspora margarita]|uniref:31937_t:CDS:1 n=1 Tax=Gigaspora margarita TaxID=4874 RepID=A0ABN7USM6_GIGMA|nr:31937_t:CDS:2 [Gigaspora margarita]
MNPNYQQSYKHSVHNNFVAHQSVVHHSIAHNSVIHNSVAYDHSVAYNHSINHEHSLSPSYIAEEQSLNEFFKRQKIALDIRIKSKLKMDYNIQLQLK